MSMSSPGTFLQQLRTYAGQQVRVRVMGAVTPYSEEYVGELSTIYDDCITMTVNGQAVLIRIAAIVSVHAVPPLATA
jgi:ribosome maturation factor RimP